MISKLSIKILLISLLVTLGCIAKPVKCKFIGYHYNTSRDYQSVNHCGSHHRRTLKYGEEKITSACFYDYSSNKTFYIQRKEKREQFCSSWGYWFVDWKHKGFKENFVEGKIYYFDLKKIEYTY